jgi:hypothetical protein
MDETLSMSKVKVSSFSVSLDGFGAGPHQDSDNPLGIRGPDNAGNDPWHKSHRYFANGQHCAANTISLPSRHTYGEPPA